MKIHYHQFNMCTGREFQRPQMRFTVKRREVTCKNCQSNVLRNVYPHSARVKLKAHYAKLNAK